MVTGTDGGATQHTRTSKILQEPSMSVLGDIGATLKKAGRDVDDARRKAGTDINDEFNRISMKGAAITLENIKDQVGPYWDTLGDGVKAVVLGAVEILVEDPILGAIVAIIYKFIDVAEDAINAAFGDKFRLRNETPFEIVWQHGNTGWQVIKPGRAVAITDIKIGEAAYFTIAINFLGKIKKQTSVAMSWKPGEKSAAVRFEGDEDNPLAGTLTV